MSPFIQGRQSRTWFQGLQEKGDGALVFNGYRVSVLQDENILEMGCTTTRIYLTLLNCTLENVKIVNFVLPVFCHN